MQVETQGHLHHELIPNHLLAHDVDVSPVPTGVGVETGRQNRVHLEPSGFSRRKKKKRKTVVFLHTPFSVSWPVPIAGKYGNSFLLPSSSRSVTTRAVRDTCTWQTPSS